MAIMISRRRIYVQFVDDDQQTTLAAVCTDPASEKRNVAGARLLGEKAGRLALEKGIKDVVVDRGGFRYHGRLKALVEAMIATGVRAGEPPRIRKEKVKAEEPEVSEKAAAKAKKEDKDRDQKPPDKAHRPPDKAHRPPDKAQKHPDKAQKPPNKDKKEEK
jgi:large subunit ribosomal protein L18